ncbi:MAG: phosphate--acyl-ACP acyltransferase, partial [Desulfovibrionaceae bacterium]|nr:phosphate--acyl-ACP acyltransferase [Desulfovibrionaceae bacterium]
MTSDPIIIAVDAMGGDRGPSVIIQGAVEAAMETGVRVTLAGDEGCITEELRKLDFDETLVGIVHASEVAEMHEKPSDILRRKKDASIQVASRLVKEGKAHGLVSAGNSGATVACGMFILGRIPGVDRPALASVIPTEKKPCVVVDVGANVDCKPHNLLQFGLMGSAFSKGNLGIENPRIALLSIG